MHSVVHINEESLEDDHDGHVFRNWEALERNRVGAAKSRHRDGIKW